MTNTSEAMQSQTFGSTPLGAQTISEPAIGLGNLTPQQFQHQLNFALQRTLDVKAQMETYFKCLSLRYGIESLAYSFPGESSTLDMGRPRHHSCQYELIIDEEHIGELVITRRVRFAAEEMQALEQTTASLAYPLRNALKFRQALKNATTDPLTGAGNRTALEETTKQELENLRRYDRPFSIALIDLDRFKQINDRYGHAAGDTVLKAVATHIQQNSRATDRFFRFGGEEFVLVMATTDNEGALINAERLRAMIAGLSCVSEGTEIPVTMSIGLASAKSGDDLRSLLHRADQALYQAKSAGRNCVVNGEVEKTNSDQQQGSL